MKYAMEIAPTGYCWVRPEVIGSTPDEFSAIQHGQQVAPDRIEMLRNALITAAERLRFTEPAGRC